MGRTLRFGEWTFNPNSHVLSRAGKGERLEPRVARLLEHFLEHRGELLSHDELVESVWEGRVVSDEAIRRAVSNLRRALDPDDPQKIIQTVHGCGYIARFPFPDGDIDPGSPPAESSSLDSPVQSGRRTGWLRLIQDSLQRLTRRIHIKAWLAVAAGALLVEITAGLIVDFLETPMDTRAIQDESSLAVLPFQVCEEGPVDQMLAGGFSGALHNRLAQRDKLKVIGRTSTEAVVRSATGPAAIAGLLGVRYLLGGVLCREGEGLTLHAELMDHQGYTVWESNFAERVNTYDQVQEQLAILVDNGVAAKFGESFQAPTPQAVDRRALENLLIGREYARQGDRAKAREALEKALQLQPEYAEAKVDLAWLHEDYSDWDNIEIGYRQAYAGLEEALALAESALYQRPDSFDANRVAGRILYGMAVLEQQLAYREYHALGEAEILARRARAQERFTRSEQHLRAALASNPSDSVVRRRLAQAMSFQSTGKRKESLGVLREGMAWDPFNEDLSIATASRLIEFGRTREAMEILDHFDVLPQGKSPVQWWWQLEMLFNLGLVDEQLARLIDALEYKPSLYFGDGGLLLHLWRLVGGIARIGLTDEAQALYDTVAAIPRPENDDKNEQEWQQWRQFFLVENYMVATGRVAEVSEPRLKKLEGMSTEEILAAFSVDILGNAVALWEAGERERVIELYRAMQHWDDAPSVWPGRQLSNTAALARMLMTVGRDEKARPLLEKVVSRLQEDVEMGVRHPGILMRLCNAYGWLGMNDQALSILELAIDYGANLGTGADRLMCCEDLVPVRSTHPLFGGERKWWESLRGEPRFRRASVRLHSAVEQQRLNTRALLQMHDMTLLLQPLLNPALAER